MLLHTKKCLLRISLLFALSWVLVSTHAYSFDENDMLSVGSSAIENIESVSKGSSAWRMVGNTGGKVSSLVEIPKAEGRLDSGESPDKVLLGLGAKAAVGRIATPFVATVAKAACQGGGGIIGVAKCVGLVGAAAYVAWGAAETAGEQVESGIDGLTNRAAAINREKQNDSSWDPFLGSGGQMLFPTSENEIQAKAPLQERVIEEPTTELESQSSNDYQSSEGDEYKSSGAEGYQEQTPKRRNTNSRYQQRTLSRGCSSRGVDITTPNPVPGCY